jgi:transposase-like protein
MSTRKKPLPPVNISQLARDHGTSRETIRKLRENGISLADDKAVAAGLACSRAKSTPPAPTGDGESYAEAKRRRAIADANRAEIIAKRESGSVIAVCDVEALFAQLGAELRSRLISMRGDLVVELEGRTGPQIFAILDKRICELLENIHNNKP